MIALAWLVCIAAGAASVALLRRAARGAYAPGEGPWRRAAARLTRDRVAAAALFVLILLAATAILAPALTPYDPTAQRDILAGTNLPPSLAHPFGTDFASRDVLTRMLFGARITLSVSVLAVLLSTILGTAYGAIAGFYGGRLDAVMMRAMDAALSVPRILLLIAVLAIAQHVSLATLVVLIGATGWFQTSRLVRAQVLVLREQEFTLAARALGARDREILWRHLLPNVASTVIVSATLAIGSVVYLEAALSYLGIGVLAIAQHVSLAALVVLIGVTGWFQTSRLVRAQVLVLREQEFTIAARALGARDREILWRHLLPNVASTVIVSSTLAIGSVVYLEAALSYLGIGVRPPTPSWGSIIQDGAADMASRWWLMLLPGLAIVITTIAINAFGDGLRDAFDPRSAEAA